MRHHQTIETPRTHSGSWWVSCTCGDRFEITTEEIAESGLTGGEYIEAVKARHRENVSDPAAMVSD